MLGSKSFQEAGSTCNFKGIERTEHFGQVDIAYMGGRKEGWMEKAPKN